MRERFTLSGAYLCNHLQMVNIKSVLTFLLLLSINLAFAQPSNDDCNSPIDVPTDGSCATFDNTDATVDIGNGDCVSGTFNVWFTFTAQGSNYDITASSPDPFFRPEITLLEFNPTPCDFASANQLNCGTDITGSGLVIGQTYYVIITSQTDQFGPFDLCVDNPVGGAPPANDDPCAPEAITANGSCNPGTTIDATGDFEIPTCAGNAESSVWYSTTIGAGNNALNINIQNTGLSGTISASVGTFTPDCNGSFTFIGDYCGNANSANFDVTGLSPGVTYFIQVASTNGGAGDFDICATEMGPPPGCADNDLCGDAETISVSTGSSNCAPGCNSGASPGPFANPPGGCFDFQNEAVWFSFTPEPGTGVMTIDVTSGDLNQPQVAVFSGTCAGFFNVNCNTGNGGSVTLNNVGVTPGTEYFIVISDGAGADGQFDLCIEAFPQGSNCNTDSDVTVVGTSLGSPTSGPFQPGEVVEICLNINNFNSGQGTNECQWLHGIVPEFGDCWDPISFLPSGLPANITVPLTTAANGSTWSWFNNGIVTYNDIDPGYLPPFSPVGAGWFTVNTPGNDPTCQDFSNPNCTFGDGSGCGDNNGFSWQVCFNLTARQYPVCEQSPTFTDCTVSFRTFGDGETGGWLSQGCEADLPWFNNLSLNCCSGPMLIPQAPMTICSGDQTGIILMSDQDPNVTYTWTVLPNAIDGDAECLNSCGNTITQILTNSSPVAQTVTYVVTPTSADGCVGFPGNIMVTVLPEIDIIMPFVPPVCAGSCVTLNPVVTGGQPPYFYTWDNGAIGSNPDVCPTLTTTYSLTITDANQCTAVDQVTVQANSNLQLELTADPGTQICQNDPDFPITLEAEVTLGGSGNYSYNWSPVAGAGSTQPVFNIGTDLYCVTVTDLITQCSGTECIEITVDLAPFVSVVPIPPLAQCLNTFQLQGVPSGGTWGGAADFSGTVSPSNLGEGFHEVTYTYTDINTNCTGDYSFDVEVIGSPDVDSLPPANVCNEYILPIITGTNLTGNQSYYAESGGTGIPYNAGDVITTTTTLYIFDGDAACFDEEVLIITIVPQPDVTDIVNQTACNFYILPTISGSNLTGNEAFYNMTGGTGISYNSGDTIFSTQAVFIFDDDGTGSCNDEEEFLVSITSQPDIDPMDPVNACNFYTLPAISGTDLSGNESYYSGTGGTGTAYAPGDVINSDITLYIYDGTVDCNDEETFEINIFLQPDIDEVMEVSICGPYTLPAITGNNLSGNESYFSGPNGTGNTFTVGDVISANTTIYIFDNAGITACEDEESFIVNIFQEPDIDEVMNITTCDEYILPNITGTNLSGNEAYFSGPGGSGLNYNPGDAITTNTTIYIFDNVGLSGCEDEESFMITITAAPELNTPDPVAICNEYTLPAITGNNLPGTEAYYTETNGGGTSYDAGDVISTTTTLFIYANAGLTDCEDEVSFSITITPAPQLDDIDNQLACNSYILPDISGLNLTGNEAYFTGPNGTGTSYDPGDEINSTITLFIFDDAGIANCSNEQSFVITITQQPDIIAPDNVSACDSYTLEAITGSNLTANAAYFTEAGGNGTSYAPGDAITTTTTLFIYDENGSAACSDEEQFEITINPTPSSDFTVTGPICTTGFSLITFTGTAGAGATYDWNFGGGTILSGSGAGPYEIQWSGAGTYNVSLSVEENGCPSTQTSESVTVEAPLAAPVINCDPSTTTIEFSWDEIPGASNYIVTVITGPSGTMTSPTSYEVIDLTPNTTVEIMVEVIGTGPCGNSSATFSCDAVDCPDITVDIDPVNDICLDGNNGTIDLNVVIGGSDGSGTGSWSGTGIDPISGTFDPATAALGANTITYTFEEASCSYVQFITINVFQQPSSTFDVEAPLCIGDTATISYTGNATTAATYNWDFGTATVISGTGQGPYEITWATGTNDNISLAVIENGCSSTLEVTNIQLDQPLSPPVINCMSSTDQITFTWNDVTGASDYDVILVNGVAGVQNGNAYEVTGLSPNDSVTITVIAIGIGSCGNSSTTTTCYANNCPVITIDLDFETNDICLDGSQETQQLSANINGGDGSGNGVWNGPGITNQINGTFDPLDPSVNIGLNTITYTYAEQGCTYVQSLDLNVIAPPSSTFTVQSPICSDQTCMINYTGNAATAANYEWDFAGGIVLSGTGAGPYEISYTEGGVYEVSLSITDDNGCVSQQMFENVEVAQALTPPVINCSSTTEMIEFSWNDVPGASVYEVTVSTGQTGIQNGNTFLVENLNPDDEVEITVTAIGLAPCGNSSNTQLCQATACPSVIVIIEPVDDICLDANTMPQCLEVEIIGGDGSGTGIWTGPGMPADGGCLFDPTDASPGPNVITYTFVENGCAVIETTTINVFFASTASFTASTPVCENEYSIIEAVNVSGATYDWDFDGGVVNSGTGAGPYEVSWPTADSYVVTLQVTNSNNCVSNMVNQTVDVVAPLEEPVINCMTTTDMIEFTWDDVDGATGYDIVVLDGPSGTQGPNNYTVTSLNPNDSVTIELTILGDAPCGNISVIQTCYATDCANITLTLDPIADFCLDQNTGTFNLSATENNSDNTGVGSWSGNGIIDSNTGLFDPNNPSVDFGPNTITYTFIENGCPFAETMIINVFQTPEVMITNGGDISCASPDLILNANVIGDNLQIQWSGGSVVDGANTTSATVDQAAWYYVTATDSITGCSNIDSIEVDAGADLPTALAGSDVDLNCTIDVAFLQGGPIGPNQQYQWQGPLDASQTNEQFPEVTTGGTYILTVIDTLANCASTPDTVIVNLNNIDPVVVITNPLDTIDCSLLVLFLDAEEVPNATYEWLDQNGSLQGTTPSIQVEAEGMYFLNILDTLNGCIGSDSINVIDNTDYPLISLATPDDLNCANNEVELNGNGSQTGGDITIDWSGPAGGISGPLDELITTAVEPGLYTLTLIDTINGCENDTTILINELNDAPTAATNNPDEIDCITTDVEINGLNSSGIGPLSYQWQLNSGTISQDASTSVSEPGTYSLIVTDQNNSCSDTTFVDVFESQNILQGAIVSFDSPSCFGENDAVVYIDTVFGGTPDFQYALEGDIFTSIDVLPGLTSGEYTLTIMDQIGCTWDTTFTISDPAEIELFLGNDLLLQLGDDANITAQLTIPVDLIDTLVWSPMEMLVCLDSLSDICEEVYAAPLNNLLIEATLTDTNGCVATDEILLRVEKEALIFVPNIFTPNGDSDNDILVIFGGQSVEKVNKFLIYDRWGEVVFENFDFNPNDPGNGWDGTLRGEALNPAVFVYWAEVQLIDGQTVIFKGDITLIR